MNYYLWGSTVAFIICLGGLLFHLIRLIRMGMPDDFSPPAGNKQKAVIYSFTGAMSPRKKESAFLHLPTYFAGLIYHFGIFLTFGLIPLAYTGWLLPAAVSMPLALFCFTGALCGSGIMAKRFIKKELRSLSTPDDYISNLLVTLFQVVTGIWLIQGQSSPVYFILLTLLFLYIPLGKLKHLLYFFAVRKHLGYFYGRRGVWPPLRPNND